MFYSQVSDIKNTIKNIEDFHDEGRIGFICDTPEKKVFDFVDSIRDFYTIQYAVVPSVLKNDMEKTYVVGIFTKKEKTPKGFVLVQKINDITYLYKKVD